MADNGWIKLHRKIRDNWIWEDPEKLRAWIDILLMVNREDRSIPFNGKMIVVKKGQKLTSIVQLSERWGWSRHRVYRFLDLLKQDNMCTADGTANGTLITVVNWDLYQSVGTPNGTTVGTPNGTTSGSTVGTQTRIKNNKEHKNNSGAGAPVYGSKKSIMVGQERHTDYDALIPQLVRRRLHHDEAEAETLQQG